jgi:hypothetical protein
MAASPGKMTASSFCDPGDAYSWRAVTKKLVWSALGQMRIFSKGGRPHERTTCGIFLLQIVSDFFAHPG